MGNGRMGDGGRSTNAGPRTSDVVPSLSAPTAGRAPGRAGLAKGADIAGRLVEIGARMIRVVGVLEGCPAGRVIAEQVLRAATSAGANYEEARGAESRRDFAHKLAVALKELQETRYWIRLVAASGLVPGARLAGLEREVDELCRILGRFIATVRGR